MTNPFRFTATVLNSRAKRYRNLVIAVSLVGLVALIVTLALWDLRGLLILLAIPFMVLLFLAIDAQSVARWRAELLEAWVAGECDLDSLREGLTSIKVLPAATIAAMLEPFPTRARLQTLTDPKPLEREALSQTVRVIDHVLVGRTVIAAATGIATLIFIAVAVILRSWWPAIGLLSTVPIFLVTRWMGRDAPRSWLHSLKAMKQQGLNETTFLQLAGRLDWKALPANSRESWLERLASTTEKSSLHSSANVNDAEFKQ